MTPPTSEMKRIHQRLDELLSSDPHLAQPVAYYRALANLLNSSPMLAPLPVAPSIARARLAAGQLVLAGDPPTFERAAAEDFFRQVCQMLQPFRPEVESVVAALDAGNLDLLSSLENLLASPASEPDPTLETPAEDPLILRVLLEYTLRPTVRAWAMQWSQSVELENWQRSTCPVCGTLPLLAEYHKSRHQRRLRCAFCGTAWPYPIRKCVYCANEDPQTQALIANHDDQRLFVQTCRRCNVYIKSIFTEELLPHDLLSLEDLASLYLDQGCQKNGYRHLRET